MLSEQYFVFYYHHHVLISIFSYFYWRSCTGFEQMVVSGNENTCWGAAQCGYLAYSGHESMDRIYFYFFLVSKGVLTDDDDDDHRGASVRISLGKS